MREPPDHPVIKEPWKWYIVAVHYECSPLDYSEPFLDLVLTLDGTVRTLRFWSPSELKFEKGFSGTTAGMQILDVSASQLTEIGVQVRDFDDSWTTFWARKVEAIENTGQLTNE